MHRQNQVSVSDPHHVNGVLCAQSKLAAGLQKSFVGSARPKQNSALLSEKPQGRPK